ncbi:MAG: 50S ribosome-binding GTPase [Planctomycetia bacterium]|nr:50S ribosome-binding GTPase [Planctomycetia bacterium]
MVSEPTYLVQLTPPGRGALATCLVAGAGAVALVEPLVELRGTGGIAALAEGRIALGRWRGTQPEEVVLVRRSTEVTLHCHGGSTAIGVLMADLVASGGVQVSWQEWMKRAAADPLAAEAAVALAEARTERCAAVLLDQMHGALSNELRELAAMFASSNSSLQPQVSSLSGPSLQGSGVAADRLAQLLAWADFGLHLTVPWRVVVCGEANVGKSSLINALLGYSRAIVHGEPGTTRDVVTATTAMEGLPVELSDTAGLRTSNEPLESAGMELAQREIAAADRRLVVFDRSAPFGPGQQALLDAWPAAIVLHSKCDLAPHSDPRPVGICTSAVARDGIDEVLRTIAASLVPKAPPAGAAVPFHLRHVAALSTAATALAEGNTTSAAATLELLLRTPLPVREGPGEGNA